MSSAELDALIAAALAEDVGSGDRTSEWTVPGSAQGEAVVVAKQPLVVAGTDAARRVFAAVDPRLVVTPVLRDGAVAGAEALVLEVRGPLGPLLTAERTALNFLGRLSGIATLTRAFVTAVRGTAARVVDTRKTTPGWRALEKAAVRAGAGTNHRMGLFDMVLIKDNHIAAAGGVQAALDAVRRANVDGLPVEIEVTSLEQLEEALAAAPERILLDNMTVPEMRRAVERVAGLGPGRPQLEASGNVSLDTVRAIAETGVDFVSVGALTHSAPVADLSLRVRA
ncbi:MAG: carboxylating nicotinate-nucleotide diphosphorylase [Longimicrobiales bacterium]|nr:carboxylating nicotinate-nucleotide diphosphorylase [Longimicrobiales bacterium]